MVEVSYITKKKKCVRGEMIQLGLVFGPSRSINPWFSKDHESWMHHCFHLVYYVRFWFFRSFYFPIYILVSYLNLLDSVWILGKPAFWTYFIWLLNVIKSNFKWQYYFFQKSGILLIKKWSLVKKYYRPK